MASVDDLCRSYLDLKYHFDPSAASSAGLVSHDARLGRFDAETTRAHVAALRSVAGAIEELEPDDLQSEIDRTALLGEIRSSIFRFEHERPHVRNPGFWLSHVFQGLYAIALAAERRRARGARAAPALERLKAIPGVPRRRARHPGRAALGVRGHRARHARRRRRAGGAARRARSAREAPEMRPELQQAAGDGARGAQAIRRRAARRDRAARRSARLRHRRGAVRPAAASRARPGGRRARALALRAAPPGGDRGGARRVGGAAWAAGGGARSSRSCAATRPSPTRCSPSTGPSWIGPTRSWRSGIWSASRASRWTSCRRRRSCSRWCRSRRTSRRRSSCRTRPAGST